PSMPHRHARQTPSAPKRRGGRSCAGHLTAWAGRPVPRQRLLRVGHSWPCHSSLNLGLQNGGTLHILSGGSFRFFPFRIPAERPQSMVSVLNVQHAPPGWRRHPSVVLAVILTAQLMVVLDATIVNVALPHIQRSLHFSNSSLSWVLNAYVLTFGGLLLLGARSGDLLGRRRTFMAGIALFSLSSLAGGFATSGAVLLAARALQGVGGAIAAPAALALLTTLFPEGAARVKAIALFTTVSAAGGALGLVAGGLLTEWASWRWVMFVNVPIGLAVLLVGRAVLIETPRRHGRFDMAGAITST